ncbi:MAG: RagB/SusD family nutrient uptake outer membrane protein [Dysgonamonadaceae bacterium]|jgi:hypothetical protein|nr:RagB/SusD family nutrient uptake outer membrane protein [Dysgonamonadaceae bacterium]
MKSNKFIHIIIFVLFVRMLTSCSGFLDEVNYSSQSAETYYATQPGYESLVNGCYASLKDVYNSLDYFFLAQIGTDLGTQSSTTSISPVNAYTLQYDANQGNVSSLWNNLYRGLKNFNAAITRASKVITSGPEGMNASLLEQRVAEMKALRALYLFEIIRNWGQAPLITEEYMAPVTTAKYNTEQEFYEQILSDLSDANLELLPWKQTGGNYGRVSRAAGKHLRALVYLTRGYSPAAVSDDFKKAYNDAVEVFNNSGHKLLDDYMMVHRQANQTNDEILFSLGFANQANYNTNAWPKFYLFPYREGYLGLSKSNIYSNDWATVMPTKWAYMQFDWMKDRRASVTFMSPLNSNPATSTNGNQYGQNFFQCTSAVAGKFALGDTCLYFPVPTDTKFRFWTQTDKEAQSTGEHPYVVYNYPSGDPADMSPVVGENDYFINGYQASSGFSRAWNPVWKFKDNNTTYSEGNANTGTRNIYIFRLAETCLIAAEAAVKSNDNANALLWINKVRSRASVNAPQAGLPGYTGTLTIDDILDERGRELLGEGSRWNDLQRTGRLPVLTIKYNWDLRNIGTTLLTQESFKSKFNRRPIPIDWLNSLSNGQELGNNPGW